MKKISKIQPNPQVFVCKVTQNLKKVNHELRQREICDCSHKQVQLEKYTAWRLLEYAVLQTFGKPLDSFNIDKNTNGKWVCDDFFLSISHNNGLCAVVVDSSPVGIDLQLADNDRFDVPLLNRIATDNEWNFLAEQIIAPVEKEDLPATRRIESWQILSLWCKKEALFKKLNNPRLTLSKIETTTAHFVERDLSIEGKTFHLAVATEMYNVDLYVVGIE